MSCTSRFDPLHTGHGTDAVGSAARTFPASIQRCACVVTGPLPLFLRITAAVYGIERGMPPEQLLPNQRILSLFD